MTELNEVIPPPPVVRDALARRLREAALLRRLLRLSMSAAEERHRRISAGFDHQPEAARPEGGGR